MSPETPKKSIRDTDQFENPSLREFLNEVGWNILSVRRIFLMLTRVNYSDAKNYGRLAVKFADFIWNLDPLKSTMAIDLDYDFDATKLEKRPAIFVGTDDVQYQKPVVNNAVKLNEDGGGEEFIYTGITNVILRHVGRTADESLAMADLSRQFFKGMRKMMMQNGALRKYDVSRITTSKPFQRDPTQADQQFEADLIITIAFDDPWTIYRESHRITHIDFKNTVAEFIKVQ